MSERGTPVKIPLTVNLHIEEFSGGKITRVDSSGTNLAYDQYADGTWYAGQRPGMNQIQDASGESITDNRGRGSYYWDKVGAKYIVNNDTVYKTNYAGSTMAISTGYERVFMGEVGDNLVIIDQQNNEGWYITSAASTAIKQIGVDPADTDFPPEQMPALTLVRGGVALNGKLYVLTEDGDIYESDIEDPTSWGALNFRNAESSPDDGVIITRHHEHVIVLGTRSLEFFQDTANPTGSTLTPRPDIQYDVGAVDTDSVWTVGDVLYFIGQDSSGAIGVYKLENMRLSKISEEDLDSFLTTAITVDGVGALGCGFISGGRAYYVLTLYNVTGTTAIIAPTVSLVYTSNRQWWGFWDLELPDVDYFPLMAWTPSTTTRAGEGILVNGDLVNVVDDFNPTDTVGASAIYVAGVFEPGIFTATGASGTTIPIEIITGHYDGGHPRNKFMGELYIDHMPVDVDEDLSISWADNQNDTYQTARLLNVQDADARLNRMGSFKRRNFKVAGSITKQLRLEALSTTARIGR